MLSQKALLSRLKGASEAGQQLAAETAEVVFAPASNLEAGKALIFNNLILWTP